MTAHGPRVVFATTVQPQHRRTGGEIVTSAFVDAARDAGAEVRVLGYRRPGEPVEPGTVDAGERPIETAATPLPTKAAWMVEALRRGLPYSAAKYRSPAYLRALRRELAGAAALVVDHAQVGWVLDGLAPPCPTVLLAHNVEQDLYAEQADAARGPARWVHRREHARVRELERSLAARVAEVWALTDADVATLQRWAGGRVRRFHVPGRGRDGVDRQPDRRHDVAVLGTWTWEPNAVGLRWLCESVVPRLGGRILHVGGAGAEWCAALPNVRYHGRVPDAVAFLDAARVVAVPALAGAGVQIKTLDALGTGAWVVATPLAMRGIDASPEVAAVADDADAFAAAIVDLCADERTAKLNCAALAWARPRAARFRSDVAEALARLGA